ncbi:hypothetical protein C9J21_22205 [Photobacterium phosphoreum]|nr:hypothetical protein C9J21_22205 [Photobacterium phosphoreum]
MVIGYKNLPMSISLLLMVSILSLVLIVALPLMKPRKTVRLLMAMCRWMLAQMQFIILTSMLINRI